MSASIDDIDRSPLPVLSIASHNQVSYGYVGNSMACPVMQSLGHEVTTINTVRYSNHTAYGRVKGQKTTSDEIVNLYRGLKDSNLDDHKILLSGYCPDSKVLREVGIIARDGLQTHGYSNHKDRSHLTVKKPPFWILDPVMGDNGKLYVESDVVPMYKQLSQHANVILPNQFEAELLTSVEITDRQSVTKVMDIFHANRSTNHVVITSVQFDTESPTLSIIGSTCTGATRKARPFEIKVPKLPVFFSGSGDLFAALLVHRLQAAWNDRDVDLLDSVDVFLDNEPAHMSPLALACQKVVASVHAVLEKTMETWKSRHGDMKTEGTDDDQHKKDFELALTKAAEIRIVRHVKELLDPPNLDQFIPLELIT